MPSTTALLLALFLITAGGCQDSTESTSADSLQQHRTDSRLPGLDRPSSRDSGQKSTSVEVIAPRFRDVAASLGLNFTFYTDFVPDRFYLPEVMGGGIACLDFDRDGRQDLFYSNGSFLPPADSNRDAAPPNVMFWNRGDRFEEIGFQSGLDHRGYGQGCAVADYDADGFPDLYLANYGENVLYRNNGDGTFSIASSETVRGKQLWSTSPVWVDLDQDGLVDLFVVNYLDVRADNSHTCDYNGVKGYCGPGEYDALPDEAFRNLGNGEFEDVTSSLGLVAENGKGLAVSVLDFDSDLKPEIYVANDMTENFLFSRSNPGEANSSGKSAYQNVALLSGCAVSESGVNEASMGVACADFDFDLRPDIFLTHYYQHKNTLYRNRGQLTFSDDSRRFRVVTSSRDFLGFGVVPFDYDSNGSTDLFIANGHVIGPKYPVSLMPPQLLANVAGEYFEDISGQAGDYFLRPTLGRGAAGVDFDNDGDTDLSASHLCHPVSLLRNDTADVRDRVIGLILEDQSRNSPVGGRVEIECADYRRMYPVISGGSYLSSPDPRLRIPLPPGYNGVVILRIYWPSGKLSEFTDLSPGRYWYLREEREPVSLQTFSPES